MKKYIYTVTLAGLVLFSCKEKKAENDVFEPEKIEAAIPVSNFEDIQKMADSQKDTVYITNYWATWCAPCVQEIPHFVELQNEYKDQKVKFMFVNIEPEQEAEGVQAFVQKYKMENVFQMPANEMVKLAALDPELTRGIPVTVVQKGEKKEGFIGSRDKAFLEQKIKEYLK